MSNQQNPGSPLKVNTNSPDKASNKEPESPAAGGADAGGNQVSRLRSNSRRQSQR